jgi:glutamate/tyrosine decarboxylase-like PLP-dependent enzyme
VPTPPLHHLFHPDSVSDYADAIRRGLDHLVRHLGRVEGPVTGLGPEPAERRVAAVDLDRPLGDTSAALEEMTRLWLDDTVWFHEPAYAAHLNCPVVVPALLAELFIASVNSSLDTYDQSVGGTFIERHVVDWTAGRIGFPGTADGVFTSGGSQSNLQALLIARSRAEERGVATARMRILASTDSHFSIRKSARVLGLPHDAVIAVPTDERRRLDVAALDRALAACVADGAVPVAVVATAGTTDFGAIDPMGQVADRCRTYDAWLHVDAAYGGGLLVSARRGHLLAGIERSDSVTVDYHKTWFQPVSASAVVVRDRASLRHVTWHADYLNPRGGAAPNQVDKSLQTTRRFDALKVWLTLRIMGPDLVGDYLDRVIDLTHEVYDDLRGRSDIELAAPPSLSTLVFRYRPAGLGEDEAGRLNTRIRATLFARGQAMVAATRVEGRQFLKLTLLNPRASADDILGVVARVREVGEELVGRAIVSHPITGPDVGLLVPAEATR